ncbi:Inactive peptidyl-prolyl cis-trans isomerase shutdown [Pseudolycoriella hygida]|uniref:peptidylprolyl isomerase n=1 Tax=Pseudolycoriella hygida TaxID=35572 RepID=A0A9Q0S736_9DIPT|nr:Inactive peptidyl-prolyl cis-trans isomerase shutdown [Pseudolycoriella hygida]
MGGKVNIKKQPNEIYNKAAKNNAGKVNLRIYKKLYIFLLDFKKKNLINLEMSGNIVNKEEELMLEDPIGHSDLLKGTKFRLRSDYRETNEESELFQELLAGEDESDFNIEDFISPWNKPFAELTPSMDEIGMNIYKKIVKHPIDDESIMGRKCRVTISYSAFMEHETCPFDSTFMSGSSLTFVTDDDTVLLGVELAVKSMGRKEESQFIIPYQLLYGELGCAPRIKPKADVLFVIQLINFSEVGDEEATEVVSVEDKRKYSYMIDKILEVKTGAIDHFRRGAYFKAATAFKLAIDKLELCKLAGEDEETEQRNHLIKLYSNLMTCYNKMDRPKKACTAFKNLSRLTETDKKPKALFQYGKAMMALGEYDAAIVALKKAQRLKPDDSEIASQLCILNEKHSKHKEMESKLWRKAMGNSEPVFSEKSLEVDEKFKKVVEGLVTSFKNNPKQSKENVPDGLSKDEIEFIENFVKDFNMKFVISEVQGKKSCYLTKTASFL